MKPLILHLKYEYYDMIKNGKKTTEYREFKSYWISRIKDQLKEIIFVPGYILDNCWCLKVDVENISIVGFKELPDYAKKEFVKSKYDKFFAINFKLKTEGE